MALRGNAAHDAAFRTLTQAATKRDAAGEGVTSMHDQDMAIVRALVPVAWADGKFETREREMMEALLEAYNATPDEKAALFTYARSRRTLDDIELENLSWADRRVVLQHAVVLSFVDGSQDEAERTLLLALAEKLRIAEAERNEIFELGSARAKRFLSLLS
jgi:tellurite resistance protein